MTGPSSTAPVRTGQPRTALTLHLLGAQVVVGVGALLVNVLASRALEPTGRGELAIVIQLSYLLSAFVLLGADKAYPAVVTAQPLRQAVGNLASLVWLPSTVVATLCLVAGILVSPYHADAITYAAVLALLTLANTAMVALRAGAVASRTGSVYSTAVFVAQGLLVVTCLALLFTGVVSVALWVLTYALCNILALAVLVLPILGSASAPGHDRQARVQLAEVGRLRRRIALSTVANMVMLRLDRLLVPLLTTTRELGLYVAVATMTELLYWPVQHYVDANLPSWRESHLDGRLAVRPILLVACGYLAIAGVVAVLVGGLSVVPLFGEAYTESADLVAPLAAAACCYGFSRVGIGIALAGNNAKSTTIIELVGAVATSTACVLLVPEWGALGAAYASLIGYFGAAVVSLCLSVVSPRKGEPPDA